MKPRLLLPFLLTLSFLVLPAWSQTAPQTNRIEDVIYGRKFGTALTMDIIKPEKPNGYGIVWVVSGGWFSAKEVSLGFAFYPQYFANRGYTVFAVVHGSQPKFVIPEIVEDMHRAVRFVRYNAKKYGINPDKIGVTGGSAGGHLSLVLATQGGKGKPDAKDPIDRESSAVQAVAGFFPPTDFLNYGKPGEDAVGVGTLANFKAAFGSRADTAEQRQKYGREISPLYFVTSNLPPVLLVHGDADKLVPMQQSESFVRKAKEAGATAKLIVRPGKLHGWADVEPDLKEFADWFDKYLRGKEAN